MPKAKKADSAAKKAAPVAQDDDQLVYVTKDGLKQLKEELEFLKNERRKQVAVRLKEAISYGDLSENAEYEEAKNEQAFVEGRILELEDKIKRAKIIDEKHHSKKLVELGSVVTIRRKGLKETDEYTIVGSMEADPFEHRISNESPVGSALMEKKNGDSVVVETPSGKITYEIVKLS